MSVFISYQCHVFFYFSFIYSYDYIWGGGRVYSMPFKMGAKGSSALGASAVGSPTRGVIFYRDGGQLSLSDLSS